MRSRRVIGGMLAWVDEPPRFPVACVHGSVARSVTSRPREGLMSMCCSARLTLFAVLATGLVAAGCASPPDAEKKAADTAVAAAQAAGAEKYAAQQFAALQVAVKTAEAQMTAKSYKEAKESYETVKRLADEALQAAAA